MSLDIMSNIGGIPTIEKPRHLGRKIKFLCRIFKGDHLTLFFPSTVVVKEVWSFLGGPSSSESYLVSQPYFVDTAVMSMQYLDGTPLLLGGDASLDLVVSHPIQPMVMLMQSSMTLLSH
jgi:hypothetical protein